MSEVRHIENCWNIYKSMANHSTLEEWLEGYDWKRMYFTAEFDWEDWIIEGEPLTRLRYLVILHLAKVASSYKCENKT